MAVPSVPWLALLAPWLPFRFILSPSLCFIYGSVSTTFCFSLLFAEVFDRPCLSVLPPPPLPPSHPAVVIVCFHLPFHFRTVSLSGTHLPFPPLSLLPSFVLLRTTRLTPPKPLDVKKPPEELSVCFFLSTGNLHTVPFRIFFPGPQFPPPPLP